MRNVKEILKDRREAEAILTDSEISYNKVNFEYKELKRELRNVLNEIDRSTPAYIEDYKLRLEKRRKSLDKALGKLEKIKNTEYDDKEEKKSHIYEKKQKIAKTKLQIKTLDKKIKKYETTPDHKYDSAVSKLQNKISEIEPVVSLRKADVSDKKKKLKAIQKEWSKKFPNEDDSIAISVRDFNIFYGKKQAIFDVNIDIPRNEVIAIIGPSGCGKSTFLKTLNRINDEVPIFRAEGKMLFQNEIDILTLENIHDSSQKMTLPELRTKIGMVFQQPNPFPMSIFNNVAYGPRINGIKNKAVLREIVDKSLKASALYEQVKDNLNALATGLSGGQQQRLCIARAIANRPDILLMDEPTSALDPIAAKKVEDLILELKKDYTIIMVTHSMQQAKRISDKTAFFYQGELVEFDNTNKMFTKPKDQRTKDYIQGKFG